MVRARALLGSSILALTLGVASHADADDGAPWLGVAMETQGQAVLVTRVISGSPADKAGIHSGDRIERVDGTHVAAATEVQRIVATHHAGEIVAVTIGRAGSDSTLQVKTAPRPTMDEVLRMDHVGKPAPAWIGVDAATHGAPSSVSALQGKVALVEFWAIWCGPCKVSAPELARIQARFGAQGLTVVGITTDAKSDAAEYAQRSSIGFSVVSDETAATTRAYGVSALPTLFVIDKRGVVRDVTVGYAPENSARVEALAQKLLAEPGP